tara:strand:- start:306 stop:524 length:219 start_codon:yes stop_codon:yes gene_type:complete
MEAIQMSLFRFLNNVQKTLDLLESEMAKDKNKKEWKNIKIERFFKDENQTDRADPNLIALGISLLNISFALC